MNSRNTRGAFTLIELLVVIGIISVLAGMLFPAFARAREKARQISCISNLRQIGMAIHMYTQDYDECAPWAKDASDLAVPQIWDATPCRPVVATMSLINIVLEPYVRNKRVWFCPSDTGFDELDNNDSCSGHHCAMAARPTMFDAFGASYLYRTEIALRGQSLDQLTGTLNGREAGPSEINVLFDGSGSWHGGSAQPDKRYVTLFGDGHTRLVTFAQQDAAWRTQLEPAGFAACP